MGERGTEGGGRGRGRGREREREREREQERRTEGGGRYSEGGKGGDAEENGVGRGEGRRKKRGEAGVWAKEGGGEWEGGEEEQMDGAGRKAAGKDACAQECIWGGVNAIAGGGGGAGDVERQRTGKTRYMHFRFKRAPWTPRTLLVGRSGMQLISWPDRDRRSINRAHVHMTNLDHVSCHKSCSYARALYTGHLLIGHLPTRASGRPSRPCHFPLGKPPFHRSHSSPA